MYASVLLLNRFEKTLWYGIPHDLHGTVGAGVLVRVPLRNRHESAMVVQVMPELPASCNFEIKPIVGLEPLPSDKHYHQFIEKIAQFYLVPPLHFYARVNAFLHDKKCEKVSLSPQPALVTDEVARQVTLTDEQQAVVDYVFPFIDQPAYAPTLVHGVTGSGKTEVYKKLMMSCVKANKSVLVLLPEVSLSLQFEQLFKRQLPGIEVFGFHSATTLTEKRALWAALLAGRPVVVLGVHLPVMLPIANLGLIIVDEEHEQGFVEKKHPKINSKEVALWRAHVYGLPIVLGSATPALTSLHNVRLGRWKFFQIKKRFSGAFPVIQKVLLNEQAGRRRKNFWVSSALEQAITECLAQRQQVMIYLNRRGYSFFVQCKSCGFIFECPHCSVSLTLHVDVRMDSTSGERGRMGVKGFDNGVLRCHYCDHKRDLPHECPECRADHKHFLKKGLGTQQAVQLFQELFPQAKIERADLDTTSKKRSWQVTVERFERGDIDILIGTQTITKGYHFPGVTLVGVLWADLNLHFPLFNASEVTLQQLIQVAGRAGRHHTESKVIVQALRDHSIFNYLNEETYIDFCDREFLTRKEIFYPPMCRLVHIELRHVDASQVDTDAESCVQHLLTFCSEQHLDVQILGPAQPLISRVQNVEIRHIFLKSENFKNVRRVLLQAHQLILESSLFVVMQ